MNSDYEELTKNNLLIVWDYICEHGGQMSRDAVFIRATNRHEPKVFDQFTYDTGFLQVAADWIREVKK